MFRFILIITIFICSLSSWGQSVDLPYTWRVPFMNNGVMETTLHPDGRMTTVTMAGCSLCSGYGVCSVCAGTGGQFWYGMGIQPCGSCGGSGRCRGCGGKGYTVLNSTTKYGVTVAFDENGKMYIEGGGSAAGGSRSAREYNRHKVDVIEYCPTYGVAANEHVYCPICRKTLRRHIHVKK